MNWYRRGMIRRALVVSPWVFSLCVACGPPASSAPVTPAPLSVTVEPPPAATAPPAPSEAAGLTPIAPLPSTCELTGDTAGLELAASADGPALVTSSGGNARLQLSAKGDAFVETTATGVTLHGVLPKKRVVLHGARWISFGGVFFPGSGPLGVDDVHDGKIVLAAPDVPGFTLAPGNRTTEVSCADVALAYPADAGELRIAPLPFQAGAPPKDLVLRAKKSISISAEPTGAPAGAFDASDEQRLVVVLEQRGGKSRIRLGHVAGWIDTAMLVKNDPRAARQAALREAAEFGMIGLKGDGDPYEGWKTPKTSAQPADGAATVLTCRGEARLLAEITASPQARYLIGSIPAETSVRIEQKSEDISYVTVDGSLASSGVRLAVPNRDLVSCGPARTPARKRSAAAPGGAPPEETKDAIEALDSGVGTFGILGGVSNGGPLPTGGPGGPAVPNRRVASPSLRQGATQVNGRLPPEVIQRIVRQNFGRFRLCYENGLRSNPGLQGRVIVKFVIDHNGDVSTTADGGSDLPDQNVVSCVRRGFGNLKFPQPESGIVTVVYPIIFAPP